jgi:hypothetical protein
MKLEELRELIIRWEKCESRGIFPKGRTKELKKQVWRTMNTPKPKGFNKKMLRSPLQ